jgi:GTPase SAR1 family protein
MQCHHETIDQLEACLKYENEQRVVSFTRKIWKLEQYVTNCKISYDEEMEKNRKCALQMIDYGDSESISSFGESSDAMHITCMIFMDSKSELEYVKKSMEENDEYFERFLQSELKWFQEILDERELSKKKIKLADAELEEAQSLAFIASMGWS